jgi:hypothetical protein
VTPILGAAVTAGTHVVKAVARDGRTRTIRIEVIANEKARYKIAW